MEIRVDDKCIKVDLSKGPYITSSKSGIGKTYLYKLTNSAEANGKNVIAFTYNGRSHSNERICELLRDNKFDFIVFDRYDLYASDELLDIIQSMYCPVFMDYKGRIPFKFSGNWCEFELTEEGIHLYLDE